MLHTNNLKEPDISTITKTTNTSPGIGTSTATTIEQHCKPDNSIEGNKGIMSLTRRPTLEQQFNLMGKQRAKNDEHVLATTNNNYSSGSSSSTKRSKSANNKIQKSPKLFNEFNDVNMEQQQQQQKKERTTEEQQKLHNNQPLIANIEHLSCQTHALAHTSSNTRPNLAAYSQPYMHHTTNTLSTFKGKNCTSSSGSALSRNSHYFSSLDNRSQRHQEHKHQQQHQQQQQQQHYMQNYSHYRQKKRKQNYDSLLPYSVANLPTLQKTNATYCSTDGSSSEEADAAANETLTSTSTTAIPLPRTPINKSGTTHYHMSHHKMHQQQQQQLQPHTKQSTKDNQGHYISPIQAKSTFQQQHQQQQQQQQQIEITSLKQNKRHKIQHRHLLNSQQELT